MGPYNGVDNILHVGEMWIICVQRARHLPNLLVNCDAIKYGRILPLLLYKPLCNTTLSFLSSTCQVFFCTFRFWAGFWTSFDQKKVSEVILSHGLKWHCRFFPLITWKSMLWKRTEWKTKGRERGWSPGQFQISHLTHQVTVAAWNPQKNYHSNHWIMRNNKLWFLLKPLSLRA